MTAQAKASFLVQGEDGMHPLDVSPITFSVPQHIIVDSVTGTVAVAVGNFPATQTVHVDNFPASQTVSVSNFPATQTVSVSNIPHVIVDSEGDRPANTNNAALALAARTAGLNTAVFQNKYYKGLVVYLNVTAVSVTGGLIVRLFSYDNITGFDNQLNIDPATITAIGHYIFLFYPAPLSNTNAGVTQNAQLILPAFWHLQIATLNAVSMTYQLDYDLLL